MNIVSLFSGAGGLDYGLIQAGHQVIWANDIDPDAVETYKQNISNHIVCADIKDIDLNSIPISDVIIGGFPCQGFSVANLKRDVKDDRNQLYLFFKSIVAAKQPKFFIAENVKGILSLEKGKVIKQIVDDFTEAGYLVEVHKVNMADYGVPQHRERVIIIGQRKDISDHILLEFPHPTHFKDKQPHWVSIKDAIGNLPDVTEQNDDPNNVCSAYKVVVRNFTAHRPTDPNKPSPTILARGNGKGGVCAIPHYNGYRRLSVRESATIQTFPNSFIFHGKLGSCYRQIGNAVPVHFGKLLGESLKKLE